MTLDILRRRLEDQTDTYLIRNFEDFYVKLLGYKADILRSIDPPSSTEEARDPLAAPSISQTLKTMIEIMARETSQKAGAYAAACFEEMKFIMAAVADEFFLNLDWEGRLYWKEHLLESRLFQTHDAGDLFFRNLDDFLRERDPMRRDLAEVYLLALGTGFQGKYRHQEDGGRLRAYCHQLYVFIYHQDPQLQDSQERLFADAYGSTMDHGQKKYLQDARQWALGFVILFVLLFLFSISLWNKMTDPVDTLMDHLLTLSTT